LNCINWSMQGFSKVQIARSSLKLALSTVIRLRNLYFPGKMCEGSYVDPMACLCFVRSSGELSQMQDPANLIRCETDAQLRCEDGLALA
jgi:hypothetical protein